MLNRLKTHFVTFFNNTIMEKTIKIGPYSYNERELAQIIRRKNTTKSTKNKKKYSRRKKHKKDNELL